MLGVCDSLNDLLTPCVCVDEDRMLANIDRMADLARSSGVALRPHIKTHKSIRLARAQIALGASGITASKPAEAMVFIEAGFTAITLAYPLFHPQVVREVLAAAARHGTALRLIADSPETVAVAADASHALGQHTEVQLKIDVGLHRCGVDPYSRDAVSLALAIARAPYLAFAGILSHAGHAYASGSADAVRRIAREECATMADMRARLEAAKLEVPEVSVGSTPTVLLNDGLDGITEIRPGNYVFLDRMQISLGAARPEDVALTVLASVVSSNQQYAIIDAGSKVLSSDRGPHGSDNIPGFGIAVRLNNPSDQPFVISQLSEEHGFIAREGRPLAVGEKLRIIPNHACPVMNLTDRFVMVRTSGRCTAVPVDARCTSSQAPLPQSAST
ncbi:alanine racemase [Solirhodobacter olei]|uniref:alanine racemase n=1 Tax=Solirhodobacter olei TaxID=2493082 RepID=UPI000FDBCD81|nr:alanine racemase [Solirhodobacter olei]